MKKIRNWLNQKMKLQLMPNEIRFRLDRIENGKKINN